MPLLLLLPALTTGASTLLPYALIWLAHIGLDRAVGYGLKLPGEFHETHLSAVGRPPARARS